MLMAMHSVSLPYVGIVIAVVGRLRDPPPIAPTPTQCAMCIMVPSPLHVQGDSPLFLTTLCRPGLGPCVQLKHGGLYCGDDFFSGYVSDGRSNFGMR